MSRPEKSEAFILQLKAKSGSIKPEEQERLDLLQTKMSGFFREKIQRAIKAPSGLIPIHSPQRPQPVQPKIEIKPTQKNLFNSDAPKLLKVTSNPSDDLRQRKIPFNPIGLQTQNTKPIAPTNVVQQKAQSKLQTSEQKEREYLSNLEPNLIKLPVVKIPPIQPKQSNNDTGFADSFVAQVINRTSSNSTNIPIEQANLITEKVAPHKLTALDGVALKPKSKSEFAESFIPQVINRTNKKQNNSLEETSSLALLATEKVAPHKLTALDGIALKPKAKIEFDEPTHKIQFKDLENKPLSLKNQSRATFTLKQTQPDRFDPIQSQAAVNSNKKRSPQIENNSTTPDLQTFPTSIAEAKQAILSTIAGWAKDIPGYYLLRVILGKDPITKESIPRNAANIIRGVISLIPGGDAFINK